MNEKTLAACAERLNRATDERTDARKALAAEARKMAEVLVRSADHLDAGTMYVRDTAHLGYPMEG